MDNFETNNDAWVASRLRALDPPQEWKPSSAAALAGIRRRENQRRLWVRSWAWTTATICVVGMVLMGMPAPAKCAVLGLGCPNIAPAAQKAIIAAARGPIPGPVVSPSPSAASKSVGGPPATRASSYKEVGSLSAPLVCEIFSDYECPSCGIFYRTIYPSLVSEYVNTGKLRIVHRDFPLPQHPFAILAAQYANAAGELGHYELVVSQLFATQQAWSANGNVGASVAQVLPPGVMQKVRAMVESSSDPQATMRSDEALAAQGDINQTPTLVFVKGGSRQKIAGVPAWDVLRAYVNDLLSK